MKSVSVPFEYSMMIREGHLDTFGHVNNAAYLEILEEARWEFITANGYGLSKVHQLKKGPIILDLQIKFSKELKNREKILIRSWSSDYVKKVSKIEQVIFNEHDEEACRAIFTFGFFDLQTRRIIPPSQEWLRAIGLE